MTLGVYGTGPYGKLRSLRSEVRNIEYELWMMEQGHKGKKYKKGYERRLVELKVEIKQVLKEIKKAKKRTSES